MTAPQSDDKLDEGIEILREMVEAKDHADYCGAPSSSGPHVIECRCWKGKAEAALDALAVRPECGTPPQDWKEIFEEYRREGRTDAWLYQQVQAHAARSARPEWKMDVATALEMACTDIPPEFRRVVDREFWNLLQGATPPRSTTGEPSKEWLEGVWNKIKAEARTVKATTPPPLGKNIEYEAVPLATVQFQLGTFVSANGTRP